MRVRGIVCAAIFFAAFGAYLWTLSPSLPAYRDSGEMTTSAYTLGVSHPPSYPIYILAGHAAMDLFPMGSPAYRLALFSAATSAAIVALLGAVVWEAMGGWAALGAAVLFGMNATFWSVAVVPEMYSLMLLMALTLVVMARRLGECWDGRLSWAFMLLYGLFLGNRTDLLLLAPGLLWLAGRSAESPRPGRPGFWRWARMAGIFGVLGLSIYAYLPLRSLQGPWLDWNHPAALDNLIGSLTRRGYGATLDMISKSYVMGSQFPANLRAYFGHLWKDYLGIGIALPLIGFAFQRRRDRGISTAFLWMYLAAGPLFLFLANMPPNPYALAIVEPHYLLSDLIVALWAAEGIAAIGRVRRVLPAVLVAALAVLPWTFGRGLTEFGGIGRRIDHRGSFQDEDFRANVLRSTPSGGTVIAKKDGQLFSLWYEQTVASRRPDVKIVAQGLAGATWYQEGWRRRGEPIYIGPLHDKDDWRRFADLNKEVYSAMDADIPDGVALGGPRGLLVALSSSAEADETPWNFLTFRGENRYEMQVDYFNSDLIEGYAAARQRLGVYESTVAHRYEEAVRQLYRAWNYKWLAPEAPFFIAFDQLSLGRSAEAADAYTLATRLFDQLLDLTAQYHSLSTMVGGIRRTAAEAHVNLGVILQRQGDKVSAERHFRRAVDLYPNYDQAHYNLAVLYWGRDWNVVVQEMSAATSLNRGNPDAARYLAQARKMLNQ